MTAAGDLLGRIGLPIEDEMGDLSLGPESLARAVVLVVLGCLLLNLPSFLHRVRLTVLGVAYFFLCHDKKWKKPQDPEACFGQVTASEQAKADAKYETRTVVFVRHGESTWNDTFNKGHHRSALAFALGFVPGLVKAVLFEGYLVLSGQTDSWFFDSPLSNLGLDQVDELAKFLSANSTARLTKEEAEYVSILRGDPGAPRSALLCSSLRRALSTVACGFRERLARNPKDSIRVIPPLQEISRNPDTLSITPAHRTVTASWVDRSSRVCDFEAIFRDRTDMSNHAGNKPLNTNGLRRMEAFCDYVFNSGEVTEHHVICGGHSIWFRSFFRTYLPHGSDHAGKKRKIVNAGCVAFTLMKATVGGTDRYMIDPNSVKPIYGGFS
jgi:hypothetical protein